MWYRHRVTPLCECPGALAFHQPQWCPSSIQVVVPMPGTLQVGGIHFGVGVHWALLWPKANLTTGAVLSSGVCVYIRCTLLSWGQGPVAGSGRVRLGQGGCFCSGWREGEAQGL